MFYYFSNFSLERFQEFGDKRSGKQFELIVV